MEHRSLFGSLSVANGGAFGISFGLERHMVILIGYRHGLPASELCDLQWSQVELATGRLHVRRAKNGSPSVHPMQGDEMRALRRLQREQGLSSHVFMTERDGPMTPKAFHALFGRIGERAKMPFPVHPHMLRHGCGYALANAGHTIPGRYSPGSATRISSTRFGTRSLRRTGSRTSGANRAGERGVEEGWPSRCRSPRLASARGHALRSRAAMR